MNWDFLDLGPLGWGILAAGFVLIYWHERRKRARSFGAMVPVPVVRVRPPASNVFRNLVVLAVVIGLGWFFWYVMGTRCGGQC
jgi:hypothetical protein